MKRLRLVVLVLALLLALFFSLRHDLTQAAWRQGDALLRANDAAGAEIAFRRAIALHGDSVPLLYDLGVSLYRKGDFAAARRQFAAALAAAEPGLSAAIHYNLGNCEFRLAEQEATKARDAARHRLKDAVANFGKALALADNDAEGADARENMAIAQAKLLMFGEGEGGGSASRERSDGLGDGRKTGADARSQAGPDGAQPKADNGGKSAGTGQPRAAERANPGGMGGKPRAELSRGEAERLLDTARGRERLSGMPHGGGRLDVPAGGKNW